MREGYTCDCFDGYELDLNKMACIGRLLFKGDHTGVDNVQEVPPTDAVTNIDVSLHLLLQEVRETPSSRRRFDLTSLH